MDILDICIHCYSTMAIFMVVKIFRSWHFVLASQASNQTIRCEIYYPICHLISSVPTAQQATGAAGFQAHSTLTVKPLELVQSGLPGEIDVNDTYLPYFGLGRLPNGIGFVGIACSSIAFYWHFCRAIHSSTAAHNEIALAVVGLACTILFATAHFTQAPRVLLRRLFSSLDAWFVSTQFTVVTFGVCDAVQWDQRALVVLSAWIWCHWVMLIDTFTPVTRKRLGYRAKFTQVVWLTLVVQPVIVAYWIFFSDASGLHNRVLFKGTVLGSSICIEAYSLLVSRVWTVWLWMGRFLWRELFRPANSFKLLKYRIEFHMPGGDTVISAPTTLCVKPQDAT